MSPPNTLEATELLATLSSTSEEGSSGDEDDDESFCSSLSHFDSEEELSQFRNQDEGKAGPSFHPVITDFSKEAFIMFHQKGSV